ncbi:MULTISPECIES: transposase [unclassified Janthinobacterium]|uniref:transposase n=1 Tax=unclassified Janthinobacterium TaxID=2610881 RepID=UPI0012F79A2B|nr:MULTISPECIES: transposase [unclassified Janthinobacterium]MEC5162393.1 hypothetical protein [Janthinobacterium sp. CG_S6]
MGHQTPRRGQRGDLRRPQLLYLRDIRGASHAPQVVGKARKSNKMPCVKWINTIPGNLKTATSETYQVFDFDKYGWLYLAEAQYRFNRRFDLANIFLRFLHAAVTTENRTEAWLRLTEDRRQSILIIHKYLRIYNNCDAKIPQ